ncbi:hypothetical protein AD948_01285 [Acetobacter senegalensis]|uniref:Uncharacterized protein n=1 Tax=Acetobacter senegalensis TaxID=446692 RepID=A0A149U7S1_9PROT|nr:hypothetical protein AD948_01285 [Acetobacter senegalensis]
MKDHAVLSQKRAMPSRMLASGSNAFFSRYWSGRFGSGGVSPCVMPLLRAQSGWSAKQAA